MLKRLLCMIGIHAWRHRTVDIKEAGSVWVAHICRRCYRISGKVDASFVKWHTRPFEDFE